MFINYLLIQQKTTFFTIHFDYKNYTFSNLPATEKQKLYYFHLFEEVHNKT